MITTSTINLTPNRAMILNCFNDTIHMDKKLSYKDFHNLTGLPITTIKDNLYALERLGVVEKHRTKQNNKRGRPYELWSLI
ncbi:MAG: hypothetical protein ACFE9R_16565 [Candidatus Hermodarchaeota archaeon]